MPADLRRKVRAAELLMEFRPDTERSSSWRWRPYEGGLVDGMDLALRRLTVSDR